MFRRAVVVLCLVSLSPVSLEAVEWLGHLIKYGDFVHGHASGADDDAAPDDEHGCTPAFHLCGCHPPSPGTSPTAGAGAVALRAENTPAAGVHVETRAGDPPLLRPPIALS